MIRQAAATAATAVALTAPPADAKQDVPTPLLDAIHEQVHRVHHYQRLLGVPLRVYRWRPERHPHLRRFYLRWWTRKAHYWHQAWLHRPRYPWSHSWYVGAMCVHGKEGAWNAVSPDGKYHGGFQADDAFQLAYGAEFRARWGEAENWPALAQLTMAWRGWLARGWEPWPNTARECGLL